MNSVDIGDRHKKQLQKNILKLFDDFVKETDVGDLEKINTSRLLDKLYLRLESFQKDVENSSYYDLQQIILKEAGDNIVNVIPTGKFMHKYRFDMLNEKALDAFKRYRVKSLNDFVYGTLQAVKNALERAIRQGKRNAEIYKIYEDTFGLNVRQEQAYNNYVSALSKGSKASLDYENRDKSKDGLILGALAGAYLLSPRQISELGLAYLLRSKQYRSKLIAETDALTIASLGEYESIVQAGAEGALDLSLITKHWVTAGDERVRENHRAIPIMNPDGVPFLEAFRTPIGVIRYPRDYLATPENIVNCRCSLRYTVD